MSDKPKLYVAGIGMITPVGFDTASTAAAVKAGVSRYQLSEFYTQETQQPITMAQVPDAIFDSKDIEIDHGNYFSDQADRIIKMAVLAIREAVSQQNLKQPVPLILAMPEEETSSTYIEPKLLIENLLSQKDLPLREDRIHCVKTGRAAGIQGLELAWQYLCEHNTEFVLVGGSDSYATYTRLSELDESKRILAEGNKDGFAPGEGAGFLLLTSQTKYAIKRNKNAVAINPPGVSQEPGNMHSDETYKGDGLDKAFKLALNPLHDPSVSAIYSSMNGENYWAKEYGVAYLRNHQSFIDDIRLEHPSDCFGDLGSAVGPVLVGLVAEYLFFQNENNAHMVYCSSDRAFRAAVVLEKVLLV